MILCDLPYGTTACKWDVIIPFDKLWKQYERIIKENSAIVLTAREPFTSKLIMSNLKSYKHKWIWNKKQTGSFANAKYMPLQIEEDIIVFCKNGNKVKYFPIMRLGIIRKKGGSKKEIKSMSKYGKTNHSIISGEYFPTNILDIANKRTGNKHPTQKPVALFEYLIKTYTNENDVVLDNCIGSGTTAVACLKTNRKFIGIELDEEYCKLARERIKELKQQKTLTNFESKKELGGSEKK